MQTVVTETEEKYAAHLNLKLRRQGRRDPSRSEPAAGANRSSALQCKNVRARMQWHAAEVAQVVLGHRGLVSAFAFVDSRAYSGEYLLSVSWDRRICVWDLRKAATACTHKVQDYFQDHVGWMDASKCLVTTFRSAAEARSPRWRAADEPAAEELACDGFIRDVCYAAELDQFAYASSDGLAYIRQFSLDGGEMALLGTLAGHDAEVVKVGGAVCAAALTAVQVLWNAVTRVWVTGSADRTARVWEARAPHNCLFVFDAVNPVSAACIDCNSGHVVVGADRIIRVFDTLTGKLVQSNSGHSASINSVMYSPLTHEVRPLRLLRTHSSPAVCHGLQRRDGVHVEGCAERLVAPGRAARA